MADSKKLSFFESVILNFVFQKKMLHSHENQSKLLGYQGWIEILMITLVYSKRVSVRNNLLHSVSRPMLGKSADFNEDHRVKLASKHPKTFSSQAQNL